MVEAPQVETEKMGSRKASAISLPIIAVGLLLVNLTPLVLPEFGVTDSWLPMVIGVFLIAAGLIIFFAYSNAGRKFRSSPGRIFLISSLVFVALFIIGTAIILIGTGQLPKQEWNIVFVLGFSLWSVGTAILIGGASVAYLRTWGEPKIPATVIKSLEQIQPDKDFKTKNFRVMKKGDIYMLLSQALHAVFFVKLFDQITVRERQVKLPLMFPGKMQSKYEIDGLPVAKSRGEIVIPVDAVKREDKQETKYVKGSGVSYLVPLYEVRGRKDLSGRFTKTVIHDVMRQLSNENERN